jgi:cytochrome P450
MWQLTDQVTAGWQDGAVYDMLVEMRKVALLILTRTLYRVDFTPELRSLWGAVLGVIGYISPGIWMLWRGVPRPQYRKALRQMDEYLYRIIALRRQQMSGLNADSEDLLGALIASGMEDGLIRDQLLTMLIAGHDTSTALLAWSLYLLGAHPAAMQGVRAEVDRVLGQEPPTAESASALTYLGQVNLEALRLYPPIHLGSRLAAQDLEYDGYLIPGGERVIYSIYLTQRHKDYWEEPNTFKPERHASGSRPTPYSWLAFGGGPRNCIGAAYGQFETKVVLARVLQRFDLELVERHVHPHMGATLEPRPGVRMRVKRR